MSGHGLDAFERVKQGEVKVGETYLARVSGAIARVRVTGVARQSFSGRRRWDAENLRTGRTITVTASRLRKPGTSLADARRQTPEERVKKLLAEYLGEVPASVLVHADPVVPGTYALRAELPAGPGDFRSRTTGDFLIRDVEHATSGDVEEVEFTQWPPLSRAR